MPIFQIKDFLLRLSNVPLLNDERKRPFLYIIESYMSNLGSLPTVMFFTLISLSIRYTEWTSIINVCFHIDYLCHSIIKKSYILSKDSSILYLCLPFLYVALIQTKVILSILEQVQPGLYISSKIAKVLILHKMIRERFKKFQEH